MRKDISLLLLELGENAVDAHASLVEIYVQKLEKGFALTVLDDGDGMSEKTAPIAQKPTACRRKSP